jgi:hypothetical protein
MNSSPAVVLAGKRTPHPNTLGRFLRSPSKSTISNQSLNNPGNSTHQKYREIPTKTIHC